MKRLNAGCGSVKPSDWENADLRDAYISIDFLHPDFLYGKIAGRFATAPALPEREVIIMEERYDVIVANHLLSCFAHHDLLGSVLPNLRKMLRPGGVLRILVPDAEKAIRAYMAGDTEWFPLGVDLPDIGERLCTYLPWFGESKSIFVYEYLRGLLRDSGFIAVSPALECGQSLYAPREWEAGSLDDRCRMSLIVEALK